MNVNFHVIILWVRKMTIIPNRNDFQIIFLCGCLGHFIGVSLKVAHLN